MDEAHNCVLLLFCNIYIISTNFSIGIVMRPSTSVHPVRILSLLLITLLICSSCSFNPQKEKERHLKKAQIYEQEEKFDSAIIELKNAIKIDPKFADARYRLGLLYLKKGDIRKAFKQLQRAASLDPENIDARLKTAEFFLMARKKKQARKQAESILKKHPNNVDALALLANLEIIEGNFDKAQEILDKAMKLNAKLDRLYTIQGRLYLARKAPTKAEEAFKKAIEINSDKLANYKILLSFYQQQKKNNKAEKLIRQMIDHFQSSPVPHILLASFYRRHKENDKAEKVLKDAVETFPKNVKLRLIMADFYRDTGKVDQAEAAYKAALKLTDNAEEIRARLADYYFEQKKFKSARDLMKKVLAKNDKNGRANLLKAKFMVKDGKNRDALNLLTNLEKNYPRWADIYYYEALAHMNLGEYELAQDRIIEAIKHNPNTSNYHAALSFLNLRSRNFEDAKREAGIALKLSPTNFVAGILLTKSILFSGDYDTAVKILEKIRKNVPDNAEILSLLGLAYLGKKDLKKAEKTFQHLLALQPDNSMALLNIVKINKARGKTGAELIQLIKEQIKKAPSNPGDLILLTSVLTQQNKYEEALQVAEKVKKLSPDNPRIYAITAMILSRLHRVDAALEEFKKLQHKEPGNAQVYLEIGTILDFKGNKEAAKEQYRKALEIQPDFAPAANNLAWLILQEPKPDLGEALRLAMIAKQQLPDNVNIIDTLGMVHYKRQAYSLARNEFVQAIEKAPDVPVFRYHLALALHGEGKKELAIKELKEALTGKEPFKERDAAQATLQQWENEL